MADDFIAYLLDGKTVGTKRAFSVSSDKDKLIEKYHNNKKHLSEEDASAEEDAGNISNLSGSFTNLLDRALKLGHSQSQLITIADATRPIFRGSAAKFEVLEPVRREAVLLDNNEDYKIYGLTVPIYSDFLRRMRRLESLDEALRDLPGTVLMGLVATFDAFVAEVVREMLKKYPDRYTSSEKEVTVKHVLSHGSFDEFVSSMVDDDVYNFTRGSHEEQIKFIEKNFDIPIAKPWKSYSDYIEIFERRNLIAHGEKKYNNRYVKICTNAGYVHAAALLGQSVKLTTRYLRQSADILLEFAVILLLTLWRKHDKDTESEAFDKVNEIVFDLIQTARYRPAISIAKNALDIKNSGCSQLIKSMLIVNLASAQKHLKQDEAAGKTLDAVDWSASGDNFRICVASIREDYEEIEILLPKVKAAASVDADSFRTWPVFSFIRENKRFSDLFFDVFGEPLVRVAPDTPVENVDLQSSGDESIH